MSKEPHRILLSPIHYVLASDNTGSEFLWAYSIYKHLSEKKEIQLTTIAGATKGISSKDVLSTKTFDPQRINLSLFKVFEFYFSLFFLGFKVARAKKIQIIHHVLPFQIGNSFNLLPIFLKKPFIIGPIQSALTVKDVDLNMANARGFDKNKITPIQLLEKILLLLITPIINFLSRTTLKNAKKLIVINIETKKKLESMGIDKEKIVIIPPGIDVKKNDRPSLNIEKKVNLLVVGYLIQRKGVDLVLRSIEEVVKTHKNIHLDIVGDGPQMQSLKDLSLQLKIDKYVTFHGFVSQANIFSYYKNASIFINMSKSEGFATVCLEAMNAGLAVISSSVGGFKEAVENDVNGYIVDQGDYKTLAKKIMYLLNNKNSIIKMGKSSREIVEKKYDWEKVIIPKYLSLYEEISKEKR